MSGLRGRPFRTVPAEDRFWPRVVAVSTGCWIWTGGRSEGGYGQFSQTVGHVPAHRWAYELLIGHIPAGLVIDHLCRTRLCVNPTHLEPVTTRENLRRGEGVTGRNARRTHCFRGHEFTPENTFHARRGERICRTCRRERYARSLAQTKANA